MSKFLKDIANKEGYMLSVLHVTWEKKCKNCGVSSGFYEQLSFEDGKQFNLCLKCHGLFIKMKWSNKKEEPNYEQLRFFDNII